MFKWFHATYLRWRIKRNERQLKAEQDRNHRLKLTTNRRARRRLKARLRKV